MLGQVPGAIEFAIEFAELQSRIAGMTDAELLEMADQPADYEPWAVDLGGAELSRRRLAPAEVQRLQVENAAEVADRRPPNYLHAWLLHEFVLPVLSIVGLAAFPVHLVVARSLDRRGDRKQARMLRYVAWLIVMGYAVAAITALLRWAGW